MKCILDKNMTVPFVSHILFHATQTCLAQLHILWDYRWGGHFHCCTLARGWFQETHFLSPHLFITLFPHDSREEGLGEGWMDLLNTGYWPSYLVTLNASHSLLSDWNKSQLPSLELQSHFLPDLPILSAMEWSSDQGWEVLGCHSSVRSHLI